MHDNIKCQDLTCTGARTEKIKHLKPLALEENFSVLKKSDKMSFSSQRIIKKERLITNYLKPHRTVHSTCHKRTTANITQSFSPNASHFHFLPETASSLRGFLFITTNH